MANLEAGIDALQSRAGEILDTSRLYCTAPQYVEDQPSFFNIVVKLKTFLSPSELLDVSLYCCMTWTHNRLGLFCFC